ncbi:MAG: hypothetical protein IJA49_03310 [Oscillospiraceae bacterium]|nr:hypothetical protein [Oscillospiraceae bacterium]
MTEAQKKMKRYMTAIERRLNLPRDVRVRVMTDLQSSVAARREAGQTDEEIYTDLGTPETVAAELSEQMKEYAYTKSKWRWAALAGAVIAGVMLLFEGITGLLVWLLNISVNESNSLGIIGGADGPTAIFVTAAPRGYAWLLWALVLVMCSIGWWRLNHCRQKET